MSKVASSFLRRVQSSKRKVSSDIKKSLPQKNACYVLITCGAPSEDGKMQVEMTYEGDPTLAAYLVESAQAFIDVEE